MRRKSFLIIVLVSLLSLISYLSYNVIYKIKTKNQIEEKLQIIPDFELKTLEGNSFSKGNLKPNLSTIFIYFNSDCDFCHHEAKTISQNFNEFKNVQFVFVSFEVTEAIKKFAKLYNLNNQENIIFLEDHKGNFSTQFNANSIPYVLIYNPKNELIKKHKGPLNAKGILKALQKND